MTPEQGRQYDQDTQSLAAAACSRFGVSTDGLITLIWCFAKLVGLESRWPPVDRRRLQEFRGVAGILARQSRLADDWPALKAKIDALRAEPGGEVAADLVMAHRIRGGFHTHLPEDDHFELEALFTRLMRAARLTFVEVRPRKPT
ncbi:MAG: hypothetical protein EPO23_13800 [Xanthobacteraceae bacterium]|nr:MAG: hypothetical protein EPO23_13800 [Xanthobacteraceae bacterium]